ncbi:class I SAM-dependent methyltransferase [Streptomyces sp. NPDC018584]|uniref:class I SAM-dependent methyltransferase n=1 Tax=unclassified Streptomyces TaxID=2593676 RepID=UPI00379DB7D9
MRRHPADGPYGVAAPRLDAAAATGARPRGPGGGPHLHAGRGPAGITAAPLHLHNVTFEQGDAQVHPFPAGGFDVVISRGGVMFFADLVAAFAPLRTAPAPGGRLAFLTPGQRARTACTPGRPPRSHRICANPPRRRAAWGRSPTPSASA